MADPPAKNMSSSLAEAGAIFGLYASESVRTSPAMLPPLIHLFCLALSSVPVSDAVPTRTVADSCSFFPTISTLVDMNSGICCSLALTGRMLRYGARPGRQAMTRPMLHSRVAHSTVFTRQLVRPWQTTAMLTRRAHWNSDSHQRRGDTGEAQNGKENCCDAEDEQEVDGTL